jgi:hypothetical protein
VKIKQWWNSNVKGTINKTVNWLEKTLGWDVNGDGKIAGLCYRCFLFHIFCSRKRKKQNLISLFFNIDQALPVAD